MECWLDPESLQPRKALKAIGSEFQQRCAACMPSEQGRFLAIRWQVRCSCNTSGGSPAPSTNCCSIRPRTRSDSNNSCACALLVSVLTVLMFSGMQVRKLCISLRRHAGEVRCCLTLSGECLLLPTAKCWTILSWLPCECRSGCCFTTTATACRNRPTTAKSGCTTRQASHSNSSIFFNSSCP